MLHSMLVILKYLETPKTLNLSPIRLFEYSNKR